MSSKYSDIKVNGRCKWNQIIRPKKGSIRVNKTQKTSEAPELDSQIILSLSAWKQNQDSSAKRESLIDILVICMWFAPVQDVFIWKWHNSVCKQNEKISKKVQTKNFHPKKGKSTDLIFQSPKNFFKPPNQLYLRIILGCSENHNQSLWIWMEIRKHIIFKVVLATSTCAYFSNNHYGFPT